MLAAMLKAASGQQQAPGAGRDTLGTPPGGGQSIGQSMGQFAQAAGAAHKQANPNLYNSNGSFNWARALGDGWAPEVNRG